MIYPRTPETIFVVTKSFGPPREGAQFGKGVGGGGGVAVVVGLSSPSSLSLPHHLIGTRTKNHPPPPPPIHPPPLESPSLTSNFKAIAKEEEGECTEKCFRETQGKHSSSSAWRSGMARHRVELTLEVYKC